MRYEFHPEALEEYDGTAHYYAQQQPGLDLRFIVCVENAIEVILEDTIESNFVLIIAVAHCSREPGHWKHRIA